MDQRTDKASYRVAFPQFEKRKRMDWSARRKRGAKKAKSAWQKERRRWRRRRRGGGTGKIVKITIKPQVFSPPPPFFFFSKRLWIGESWVGKKNRTSDAGSQYRCGRVGKGIQPQSTPQISPHTQTYTKGIQNARFYTFRLNHYGPTDQRTDGRTKPLRELHVRN